MPEEKKSYPWYLGWASALERIVRYCILKPIYGKDYEKMRHTKVGIVGPTPQECRKYNSTEDKVRG